MDARDPEFVECDDQLARDLVKELEEMYPDSKEEIDVNLPKPLVPEIALTLFVDTDHAHDKVTRRSVTGILCFLGRTPIFSSAKRQGAIETSTYGAEFCGMKSAVEEAISIRYMLRCLGVEVNYATPICGDNSAVIQNSTVSDSLLKKKHVAIAYHKTREAAASGIIHPIKIGGKYNFADVLTKAQVQETFNRLMNGCMYG